MREWNETAFAGTNSSSTEGHAVRGGNMLDAGFGLMSLVREERGPAGEINDLGFRVASVPEPSTYALLLLGAGAVYLWKRRQGSL